MTSLPRTAFSICLLASVVLLLGACGGADSGSSAGMRATVTSEKISAHFTPYSREQARAYHAVSAFYDALTASVDSAGDARRSANSACGAMSVEMQRHIVVAAKAIRDKGVARSCRDAMTLLLVRSSGSGAVPLAAGVQLVGVKISGTRDAVAVVREPAGGTSNLRLVKEGGAWKVSGSGVG